MSSACLTDLPLCWMARSMPAGLEAKKKWSCMRTTMRTFPRATSTGVGKLTSSKP